MSHMQEHTPDIQTKVDITETWTLTETQVIKCDPKNKHGGRLSSSASCTSVNKKIKKNGDEIMAEMIM